LTVSGGRPPRMKERKAKAGRALRLLTVEQARLYRALHTNKKDAAKAASFLFSFSSSVTHALAHRHREMIGGGT
ncbi:hypothetical protein, partial [Stenotrophomonas maltophilia]|uniref:hypothetical protein n=1 Tax=Stenotrophomonas maltophilia TaxID=40324 RepID=UPI0019558710